MTDDFEVKFPYPREEDVFKVCARLSGLMFDITEYHGEDSQRISMFFISHADANRLLRYLLDYYPVVHQPRDGDR